MAEAVRSYFGNYFNFAGRASRRDYWLVQLFLLAVTFFMAFLGYFFVILAPLWVLFNFIPSLSLYVRRLHDTNKSAWMLLLMFLPALGEIILFIFTLLPGTAGVNRYGYPDRNGWTGNSRSYQNKEKPPYREDFYSQPDFQETEKEVPEDEEDWTDF